MANKAAIEAMRVRLTAAIQLWLDAETEDENDLGFVGGNLAALMADAGIAVVAASEDVQEYMHREGYVKN